MRNVFEYYKEDYLAHHGIKGQKWGIRRYQNADGSLTDAGRQRYMKDANGALDPNAKKRQIKYTTSYGKSFMLNSTEGNVRVREHVIDASKTSKKLSNLLSEARRLNAEEEGDWEAWMGDKKKSSRNC